MRERYEALRGDDAQLEGVLAEGVLAEGAEKGRAIATGTLADVREAMAFGPARRSVGPAT